MLLLDGEGKERVRLEGDLSNSDFIAALRMVGRIAFVPKKYADAERQPMLLPGMLYRATSPFRA